MSEAAVPNVGDVIRTYMKLRDQKATIEARVKDEVSTLKAKMEKSPLFRRTHRVGMHTYDDASLFIEGRDVERETAISVVDVTSTIFDLMDLPVPDGLDGKSLLGTRPAT